MDPSKPAPPGPTDAADAIMTYLVPEIEAGKAEASLALKQVNYKRLGLAYVQSCKDLATAPDGTLDIPKLKAAILAAVDLLQNYHDEL